MKKYLLLVIFCSFSFSMEWYSVGPGGGGAMYSPAISPHNSDLIFVSCDMGGAYRTFDGGENWDMINFRQLSVSNRIAPVFHPSNPSIVWDDHYADWTDYLVISTDGGASWENVMAFPTDIFQLLTMPDEPLALFMAAGDDGIYRSTNGTDFSPVSFSGSCYYMACNNTDIFASGDDLLYQSIDRGASFSPVSVSGVSYIEGLAVGDSYVYLMNEEHVYRKPISSGSWEIILSTGDFERGVFGLIRAHGDHIWVTSRGGSYQPSVYLSTNAGESFEPVFFCNSSWDDISNLDNGWLSLDFVCGWGGAADGFGISPTDPYIAVWTDNGRALATFNDGATWQPIYTNFADSPPRDADKRWSSVGLEVTSSWDVHIAEDEMGFIRIAYTDIRGAWSTDAGDSWYIGSDGIPSEWANTNYDLVKDTDTGILWGSFAGLHDIPAGWSQGNWYQSGDGGIASSTDNGRTWSPLIGELPDDPVTSIAIDYTSSPSSRRLFVAVWSNGVWRSNDGGTTWERASTGLDCGDGSSTETGPNTHVVEVQVHPDGTVFALKNKYIRPGSEIKNDAGLWRSTDNGDNWEFISDYVPECNPVSGIDDAGEHSWADAKAFTLDSDDSDHLWVGAANVNNGKVQGGLYETIDGGDNWERILSIYGANRLTKSIYNESLMYLATVNNGVMISTDNGASWDEDEDFPFSHAMRVVEDPYDETIIWVNTFGGGVFKGITPYAAVVDEYLPMIENYEIKAYPNPFNKSIIIDMPANAKLLGIYDILGKNLSNINGNIWHPKSDVKQGIYFIKAKINNETIAKPVQYMK